MTTKQSVPLEDILRSTHKWFLGGGRSLLWAPDSPKCLTTLGFWDHAVHLDTPVPHPFTLSVLDRGAPLQFVSQRGDWVPSHLSVTHTAKGLTIAEDRALLPDDTLAARLTLRNTTAKARTLDLVLWSVLPTSPILGLDDVAVADGRITLTRNHLTESGDLNLAYRVTYALTPQTTSHQVSVCEPTPPEPCWSHTPFTESFTRELANTVVTTGGPDTRQGEPPRDSHVYLGLHLRIKLPPRKDITVSALCNISPPDAQAESLEAVLEGADPIALSQDNWQRFFESVPHFTSSDAYLEKYYWYRWYGLRLNMVQPTGKQLEYPCVFEGTNAGHFRHAISYSAFAHMFETRWMHDPAVAKGSLFNFLANQSTSGVLPSRINTGLAESRAEGLYHANWGDAVLALHQVHPDDAFLEESYEDLCRYATYLDRERDRKSTGLTTIVNQGETGQEYSPRYLAASERADQWVSFQLKGVDATVYAHQLFAALTWIARRLSRATEGARWNRRAERAAKAIVKKMWDGKLKLFCDVVPKTGERSPVKTATCFYPFLTDLPNKSQLAALEKHLFNPDEFWTPYPVASTALTEELANPVGLWKGRRQRCPWNGRVWPMTNSHIAEAIAHTAIRTKNPKLRKRAAEFIGKFIRMLFADGDLERPTSCEHYNPLTGQPSWFKGVDDYMHSWVVDLIIKYVAGVRPTEGRLCIDPFDFGLSHFALTNLRIQGHEVDVHYRKGTGMKVHIDGHLIARTRKLEPVYLGLV